MYSLNRDLFKQLAKHRGFRSIGELCAAIGVHRNSLSRYLNGASVYPEVLEKAFSTLEVDPHAVLIKHQSSDAEAVDKAIRKIAAAIVSAYPNIAVILFGSRTKGKQRKYSDIDIGVLADKTLPLDTFSSLKEIVETTGEDLPYKIDLVDLGRADREFLKALAPSARFIGGNPSFLEKLYEYN